MSAFFYFQLTLNRFFKIDHSTEKTTFKKISLIRVNVSIEQLRVSEIILFIIWGLYFT